MCDMRQTPDMSGSDQTLSDTKATKQDSTGQMDAKKALLGGTATEMFECSSTTSTSRCDAGDACRRCMRWHGVRCTMPRAPYNVCICLIRASTNQPCSINQVNSPIEGGGRGSLGNM